MPVMSSPKLFLFPNEARFIRCETVIVELCCVIKVIKLLYYLREMNNGRVHIYQFTFELFKLWFRMWLWFRI